MMISMVFIFLKKFPGLADKRDRLELIDYDQLTINDDEEPKQVLRTRSMVCLRDTSSIHRYQF